MTTRAREALLALLRGGLHGQGPDGGPFTLSDDEWRQVFETSRRQDVESIVGDAIARMPEPTRPPTALRSLWQQAAAQTEQAQQKHLRAISYLTTRLQAETELRPVVVKGVALAVKYPVPAHRPAGDIDLYYGSAADCEKANRTVEQWGMKVVRGKSLEAAYMLNGITIEHHGELFLMHDILRKKRTRRTVGRQMADGSGTIKQTLGGLTFTALSPEMTLLQLAAHSYKHALNEGITLRQVADVYIVLNTATVGKALLRELLRTAGMEQWFNQLCDLSSSILGLSPAALPWPVSQNSNRRRRVLENILEVRPSQTARRIAHQCRTFARYAPAEACCWLSGLLWARTKELFTKPE